MSMTAQQMGRVVFWMAGTLLSFSAMAVSVRALAGALSIFEILAIRNAIGLTILIAIVALHPQLRGDLVPRRMGLYFLRNIIHQASQYAWALSVILLPLATVFALEFTMPAWTTVLAVALLGERLTPSRAAAIVLGLVGVLVIIRPGLETFQPAALLVLAASFGYATVNIATKKLTSTESTFAIIFWMNLMQLPIALLGSDLGFVGRLDGMTILPAVAIGVAGVSSHYCLTNAFRAGDASVVVPLDFLRMPLIAIVGWLFYAEPFDPYVFLGAGLIVAGVMWNLSAELRGR
jgi:drug/metabolite transporter (DMT)-like permease